MLVVAEVSGADIKAETVGEYVKHICEYHSDEGH